MVEKELSVELPGSNVRLKGVIDLVEEDFCITDFKTTTLKWTPSKVRNLSQMIIYKYLFDRTFGPLQSTLKYEVLYAKDAGHVRHQTFRVVPESDAVDRMLAMIHWVAEQIEAGAFQANETYLCRFCEYTGLCREKGGLAENFKKT
jgi:RecB family exonuclease